MEARTLQAFLRVLYTVNSNPQYILAKSSSQVPAIICSDTTAGSAKNDPAYARAPLKACLVAVCDSSPELLQDPARDFSLYVLDPLEAQPLPTSLAHASHNTGSPRGVAVALGLMSWALESNDSTNVFVTGTIIPNASPALEVVFALRETKRMPKPMLHSYPSLGPMSAPAPPQPLNPSQLPQVAGMSWLSTSHLQRNQQEQRTLTRSADFPELYIGPPRRSRGRPEGSISTKSRVTSQTSATSLPGVSLSEVVETPSESKQEVERKSRKKTKPKPPRPPPTHSPFVCAPLTRHTAAGASQGGVAGVPAFYQQSHPSSQDSAQSQAQLYPHAQPYSHPTHNPLLGLLPAILSTSSDNAAACSTPEQQAALLAALQGLLATNPHLLQLAATNTRLSAGSGEQSTEKEPLRYGNNEDDAHDDGDSDIVILDSSTVDTTAFRKPNPRSVNDQDPSPLIINQDSLMSSSQGIDSSPLPASTPPSGQENTPTSVQMSTPSVELQLTPTVTPETETPTSKHVSIGQRESRNITVSHALDIPATPTPSRTRKRKLNEYIHGQAHSSRAMSPPSPSPSVMRTSSSGRALTAGRHQSSPTSETKSGSLTSVRLPSMLGSMRTVATSGSRPQINSSVSSTRGHAASLTSNKNGNQSTTVVPGPSKSKAEHAGITDASLNGIASDTTSLKRRRTLSEFMAEQEARRNARVRKHSSSGHKLEIDVSADTSRSASMRSAKLLPKSQHAHTSPPRPLFRTNSVASSLPSQPSLVTGAAVSNPTLSSMTMSTCATPSTSVSTAAPTNNPLKNFVLPAWARTGTAMLPRLSEEAQARQRAEREAKKAQISSRRREAAKAKRNRPQCPSKESSDEDDETVANDTILRTRNPSSSVARSVPLLPPPLSSLPVFASDAVEPIPSSPPRSPRQLASYVAPSTPPRKLVSSGSVPHRTPSKTGSCSLFTPSGQDPGSLFTPSTPSVTRSLTFTPRSPTVLHHSGVRKSPRKSVPQTPWTPKCSNSIHQTPRSLRTGREPHFMSPSSALRTPQTQTGMGTRAFLLPPPSPCALRMPYLEKEVHSRVPGGSASILPQNSEIIKQGSPPNKQNVEERDRGSKEEDKPTHEPGDAPLGEDVSIPSAQCSPNRLTVDEGPGTSDLHDVTSNGDASKAEDGYASSPLPPSSPLPISPFSSPVKHNDSSFEAPIIDNLVIPDSDILLPDSWLTDPEANAWLTETETWLTDTEGALLTDSDGAWLSDSDAVFGDMSSLPPSSASNWLSDDADVDTDVDVGVMEGRGSGFDTAAFERAFAALVEHGGRGADKVGGSGTTDDMGMVESEFWESVQSLLGANTSDGAGPASRAVGGSVDRENGTAQDGQEFPDGFVGS